MRDRSEVRALPMTAPNAPTKRRRTKKGQIVATAVVLNPFKRARLDQAIAMGATFTCTYDGWALPDPRGGAAMIIVGVVLIVLDVLLILAMVLAFGAAAEDPDGVRRIAALTRLPE